MSAAMRGDAASAGFGRACTRRQPPGCRLSTTHMFHAEQSVVVFVLLPAFRAHSKVPVFRHQSMLQHKKPHRLVLAFSKSICSQSVLKGMFPGVVRDR